MLLTKPKPNRAQLVNFPLKQGGIPFHLTDDSSRVKTQRDQEPDSEEKNFPENFPEMQF